MTIHLKHNSFCKPPSYLQVNHTTICVIQFVFQRLVFIYRYVKWRLCLPLGKLYANLSPSNMKICVYFNVGYIKICYLLVIYIKCDKVNKLQNRENLTIRASLEPCPSVCGAVFWVISVKVPKGPFKP